MSEKNWNLTPITPITLEAWLFIAEENLAAADRLLDQIKRARRRRCYCSR